MNKDIIGLVSGVIVIISVVPYAIRTWQAKIPPNPTSWGLWTVIGLVLLLTFYSSGAKANLWPVVFGFTNPLLIFILLLRNRAKWKKFENLEYVCLVVTLISLWMWLRMHDKEELAQYALYAAILADICAAIPTIAFVWRFPLEDRPFAWVLFSTGYGLSIFAISEHTFSNYILPACIIIVCSSISFPLIIYRIRARTPLKEWM